MPAFAFLCLYMALKEKHKLEMERERRKHKRRWSRNIVKLHRTLSNMNKEKRRTLLDIKHCLNLKSCEAEQLYHVLMPCIENQYKPAEDGLNPRQMLEITLIYLSANQSVPNIAKMYDIDVDAVKSIVNDTCKAVYSCLKYYMKMPNSEEEWKAIAEQFERQRKFPNCIGAVILKHIAIKAPKNYHYLYLNTKGYYSQIIYALVNANHEIFYMEVVVEGSLDGDSVFWSTDFSEELYLHCTVTLPSKTSIRDITLPYVFVADNSHTLRSEVIVPFLDEELTTNERKLFNDRWAYAKRVADDAMELMQSKFKILKTTIDLDVENAKDVINACVALHNYMIRNISSYKVVEIKNKSVNVPRNEALLPEEYDYYYEDFEMYRDAFAKYFSLDTNVTKTGCLDAKVTKTECMEINVAKTETIEMNEPKNDCLTNETKVECLETKETKTECLKSNESKNDSLETKTESMEMNATKIDYLETNVVQSNDLENDQPKTECLESNETKNDCLETNVTA